ncbi:MAG: hypothetical protein EON58_02470 [Alphaproteobacteria bacterium]|nr:MAG: hypothetical protein EON58_02470 [Alphaproteobacteria bacterium]
MDDGRLPPELRAEFIEWARIKRRRFVTHSDKYPSPWHPTAITNPVTRTVFTEVGAWEWIAELLEAGIDVWATKMDKPPGIIGWYFTAPSAYPPGEIYVKFHRCGNQLRGRSFHYSEPAK